MNHPQLQKTILFIDAAVANTQQLIQNLSPDVEVFLLDSTLNGIDQITQVLAQRHNINSIQIISHGNPGRLQLGSGELNRSNLQGYHSQLQQWGQALAPDGDFLLFGCQVGEGTEGQDFIQQFSQLTGADIAASDDLTGNQHLGGNWDLEVKTGEIEARTAISAEAQESFTNILGLRGEYFNGRELSRLVGTQEDAQVNFINWGSGQPNVNGKNVSPNNENFSIRWNGYIYAPTEGLYTFNTPADDGILLWVNNKRVINDFVDADRNRLREGSIYLTPGYHPLTLEYYEAGGDANIQLRWKTPLNSNPTVVPSENLLSVNHSKNLTSNNTGLKGTYYNDYDFTEQKFDRVDSTVHVNYGLGSPNVIDTNNVQFPTGDPKIDHETFSIIWEGYVIPTASGYHTISIKDIDDEVTLEFAGQSKKITFGNLGSIASDLKAGQAYPIKLLFKEGGGSSAIKLEWEGPSVGGRQPIHFNNLYPGTTPPPRVWIEKDSNVESSESSKKASFKIKTPGSIPVNGIDVFYKVTGVNGAKTDDFSDPQKGKIRLNGSEATLEININDDIIPEGDLEGIQVELLPAPWYQTGESAEANNFSVIRNIIDNEPTISLIKVQDGEEGKESGKFNITFDKAAANGFDLKLQIAGTAVQGTIDAPAVNSDYKLFYEAYDQDKILIPTSGVINPSSDPVISVPPNTKTIVLKAEPINNELYESNETVIITLKDNNNQVYKVNSSQNSATVTLGDNEPTVSLGKVVMPTEGFGFGSTIQGLGSALNLDGKTYVSIPPNSKLDLSVIGQFTQEAWIFPNSSNSTQGIFGYQPTSDNATNYPSVEIINGSGIKVGFGDGIKWNGFTVNNALNPQTWNHLAATFDGEKYKLYVNGVEIYTDERFAGTKPANTQQLEIGKVNNNYFQGVIDEVRLWNVARSGTEIQSQMLTPLQGEEAGLIGYWKFEGNTLDSSQPNRQDFQPANGIPNIEELTTQYINNPAPQIGYVEVNLDKPFEGPQGLWVKYNISGDATQGVDYFNSQYQKVSTDPNSKRDGIIIPQGQTQGQIYIIAKPDEVREANEKVNITIQPHNFDNEAGSSLSNTNYNVAQNNKTVDLTITDNTAYQSATEVILLDQYDRPITANNPLSITADGKATFKVKLASQPPTDNTKPQVKIEFKSGGSTLQPQSSIFFNKDNWDQPQTVTLKNLFQSGLQGEYFSDTELKNRVLSRPEQTVNFNWGQTSPNSALPRDNFSARWTGLITPTKTEDYTFYTVSDDGVRLWVNDQRIINNWTNHAPTEDKSQTIKLEAGKSYSIRLEYYEATGGSQIALLWSSASQPKQIIPASQFPSVSTANNISASSSFVNSSGNFVSNYTNTATTLPLTTTPSQLLQVTEGSQSDATLVTPEVSIEKLVDGVEGNNQPGQFVINLNAPAPEKGITLEYTVSGTAKLNEDYTPTTESEIQQIQIPAGATRVILPFSIIDNPLPENREDITVTLKSGTGYTLNANRSKSSLNITDNDALGIEIANFAEFTIEKNDTNPPTSETKYAYTTPFVSLVTGEDGKTDTVGVRLQSKPTANVTLELSISDATEGTFSLTTLTFTPENWDQYQKVTVTGQDDFSQDGDIRYAINGTAKSSDSLYNGKTVFIPIINLDNETAVETTQEPLTPDDPNAPITSDDPNAPIATVSVVQQMSETQAGKVKIELSEPVASDSETVTLLYAAQGGSATVNQDYRFVNNVLVSVSDSPFGTQNPGKGSKPSFGDLDQDGDLDAVVGTATGEVKYYENIGSNTLQEKTGTNNPFSTIKVSSNAAPVLVDLNGDGKLDLGLGEGNGALSFYVNKSDSSNLIFLPSQTLNIPNPFATVKTLGNSTPTFGDLNQDGKVDLVLGSSNGSLTYYPNQGSTSTQPRFAQSQNLNLNVGQNSTPHLVDWDVDGDLDLLAGNSIGQVKYFQNTGSATSLQFTQKDAQNPLKGITLSPNSAINLADLDSDGDLDAVAGDDEGLHYYQQYQAVDFLPGEQAKEITIQPINDLIDEGEKENLEISLIPNQGYRLESQGSMSVNLNITDNDQAGLKITPTNPSRITTSETGEQTLEYSVSLESQPTDIVKVYLGSNDASEAQLKTSASNATLSDVIELEFTPDNWNQEQKFFVQGVDDQIADGDIPYQVIPTTSSEDLQYRQLEISPISLTNKEDANDKAEIIVTKVGDAGEGKDNLYKVKLTSQPVGEVRVIANPTNDQIRLNTEDFGDATTLIFDETNWNIEQIVRVSAFDDNIVEFTHNSQIEFQVETGEKQTFESKAVNNTANSAIDLGEIKGGYTWENLAVSGGDRDWFKFSLPDAGSVQDFAQIQLSNGETSDLQFNLYKSTDLTTPIKSNGTTANQKQLALNGLERGEYFLEIYSPSRTSFEYNLILGDEDYQYVNNVNPDKQLKPLDVQIKDNDLVTAQIIAGPTASEISGQPGYFTIALNAPAPKKVGDTGIKVNYEILKNSSATENLDYQITNTGAIRIAPGDAQNNLIIVPIDDKLTEDLGVKVTKVVNQTTSNGKTTLTLDLEIPNANEDKKGLQAQYFYGREFQSQILSKIDSTVDFIWRQNSPNPAVPADDFSVRWTGQLLPTQTEDYTFYTISDDGVRLWINNQLVIDNWTPHAATEDKSQAIKLEAGKAYDIRLEYYEAGGDSQIQLFWSNPSQNKQIIPVNRLVPVSGSATSPTILTGRELMFGEGLVAKATKDVVFKKDDRENFIGQVTVEVDDENASKITANSQAKIAGESVSVRLLPGEGYRLGDENTEASLVIQDDDVPGVRIVEVGENTTVEEDKTATFAVSLLSEPTKPVTLTLTPGAEVEFVNPSNEKTTQVPQQNFSFDTTVASNNNLDVKLNSLVKTDKGDAIAFEIKLKNKPTQDVKIKVYDGNDQNPQPIELTFTPQGVIDQVSGEAKPGNWDQVQEVIIYNLDQDGSGKYKVKAEIDGQTLDLPINQTTTQVEKQTTSITINPEDWYKLQTVTIQGSSDDIAEPGIYHTSGIKYQVTSGDTNYNNLFVPDQTIQVVDRQLNPQETASAMKQGLGLLQESIDSLSLPLVGNLDDKNPNLLGDLGLELAKETESEDNLTASKLQEIIENVLKKAELESFNVTTDITEQDIAIQIDLSKQLTYRVPLASDLGVPALGIGFDTQGDLNTNLNLDLSLAFGLHKQFGFYIDTKKTQIDAGFKVDLQNFKGKGNLGFLQLDFANDPENPTKLEVSFSANLNDIDDIKTQKTTSTVQPRKISEIETKTDVIDVDATSVESEDGVKTFNPDSELLEDLRESLTGLTKQKSGDEKKKVLADTIKAENQAKEEAIKKQKAETISSEQETVKKAESESVDAQSIDKEDNESLKADQETVKQAKSDPVAADSKSLKKEDSEPSKADQETVKQAKSDSVVTYSKSNKKEDSDFPEKTEKHSEKSEQLSSDQSLTSPQGRAANPLEEILSGNALTQRLAQLGISALNSILPSGQVALINGDSEITLTYKGTTNLTNWISIDGLPTLALSEPTITYNKQAKTYSFASGITINSKSFNLAGSLEKQIIDGVTELNWQSLNVSEVPVSDFGGSFPALKSVLPGTGKVGLELANDQIQVEYSGEIDVSSLIKNLTSNLSIPTLFVNNPVLSYQTSDTQKQYSFKSDEFDLDYTKKSDNTYTFFGQRLPIGDLVSWLQKELGIGNIGDFSGVKVDLEITPEQKQVQFLGNIDLTQFIKAIAGNNNLPIPSLELEDPSFTYRLENQQKQYSFKSGEFELNYTKNSDNTYSFIGKGIPVGKLTNWIETELGVNNISNFITGDGDIDLEVTPDTKAIRFNGNVDISQLVKAIANNQNLSIPSLNLQNPSFTYTTKDDQTQYRFTSETLKVEYTKNTDGSYEFNVEELPVGNLTNWLQTELEINSIGDFIDGEVNLEITPNNKQISFDGNVNISELVKAVAGNPDLTIPSLKVSNPVLSYKTDDQQTQYRFTSDTFSVDYIKKADDTYNFAVKQFPIGDLTKWVETEFDINNIGNFIKGNANLNITPTTKELALEGSVDISELVKAIAKDSNLPIPSLKLDNPILSYSSIEGQTQYDFQSDTVAINYTKNADNTYSLTAEKIPIGDLTTWVGTELGISNPTKFISGNVNINVTPETKKIALNGNVDLNQVVQAITDDSTLSFSSLDIKNPILSYTTNSKETQYSFSSTDGLGFTYTKDNQGKKTFTGQSLPIGDLTTLVQKQLGLNDVRDVIDGTVDILLSSEEKQLSLKGGISFTKLAQLINLPIPSDLTNLTLQNPNIIVTGTGTNRSYEFSGTGAVTLSKDTFGDFTEVAKLLPGISADTNGITLSGDLDVSKSSSGVLSLQGVFPGLGAIKLSRENNKWKLSAIEDGDRLTLSDLAIMATDKEYSFTDLFSYEFKGDANLGIKTKTSIQGDSNFPSFSLDVAANLPLFNYGDQAEASKKGLDISFNDITLDAGSFISDLARPVIETVDTIIDPIKPVVKALNADTKFLSYIGLENQFNKDKKPGVSLLDIAGTLGDSPILKAKNPGLAKKIETAALFSQTVTDIVALVETLNQTPTDESFSINFGDFKLDSFKAASQDKADSASTAKVPTSSSQPRATTATNSTRPPGNFFTKAINKLESIGVKIPLIEQPTSAFKLVLGQTTDLIKYDIPDLDFGFNFDREFTIYTPPNIKGLLGASFNAKTDFSVGFDTYGLNQWKAADYKLADSYKVLDGFYLDDWSNTGQDKDEMSINAQITAGLALDIVVAEASLRGGIDGNIRFDLEDVGERNGTSDGKVRGSEIVSRLNRPLSLFELTGALEAFLRGEAKIGFWRFKKTVWSRELGRFKLAEFKIDESGFNGSVGGRVSNSYIADAFVYLDANLNNQLDDNEPITKTNNTGEFNLEFDLTEFDKNENGKLDEEEGQIVALGGIDSSTGVPLATQLITGVDSAMITPLTNLENFLVKQGYVDSLDAAEKLIAKRLGLSLKPLNIDLEGFDPLEALSSALVAEQEMGVDIYLAHIKVQNLMIHADAFLQGLKPNLSTLDLSAIQASATQVLAEILTSESGVFDLNDPQQLQSIFSALATLTQKSVSPEVVALVAQTVANSNQMIDDLAAEASDRTVAIVMQTVAPIKQAVQGDMAEITHNLTSGELTPEEAQQQYQEQIDTSNFLIEPVLSDERTLKIYGMGDLEENSTAKGEIIIELGEAAPNQGLNILYSLSGTATLGEDYQFSGGSIGQLYIEPGATAVKFEITALDDTLSEGSETIAINLRYGGEGFQIDPEFQTALVTLTDDEPYNSSGATLEPLAAGTVGNDVFEGTEDDDSYNGNYGDDQILGNGGSDRLQGNFGNDTIEGGDGNDIIEGNYGMDYLEGNEGDDQIQGGDKPDTLVGGEGNDQLNGQTGDDLLKGGKGNDFLEGNEGNDRLEGEEDNDWLLGGAGNDILIGGEGQDALNGGDGADRFVIALDASIDNLLDFDPLEGDTIVIDVNSFNTENLNDFQFIGGYLYYQEQQIASVQNDGKIYNTFSDLSQVLEFVEDVKTIEIPDTPELSLASTAASSLQKSPPQPRNAAPQSPPSNFLEEILQRGYVKVGIIPDRPGFAEEINGELQGYSIGWGRALAAALFGDPSKVEFVQQEGTSETIENVANRQIDVATTDTTVLLYRDAALNIDYSPVHLYDTRAILVKQDSGIQGAEDLEGLTIGVTNAFGWQNLQNFMRNNGIEVKGKLFDSTEEMYAAYERGEIDALTGDRTRLKTAIPTLADPNNHLILDEEISQEPIAMVLPENESEWADVVRWATYTPMQAEEYGISSANIDQFIANNTDPAIRRFLGLEGGYGEALGLSNDFVVNTIKSVGNYGEIAEQYFPAFARCRNELSSNDGLIYSLPFADSAISDIPLIENDARNLLAEILQRGTVKVGVADNNPGFAQQVNGDWTGIDTDLARAISAALFGNPNQVEFVSQDFSNGFANAANGVVDVSAMGITHTSGRDGSLGIDYSKPYFYTGAGILARTAKGITSLPMLNGHKVGVIAETTTQQNLEDALARLGANFVPMFYESNEDLFDGYKQGEIDALVTDLPIITSNIQKLSNPSESHLLDEMISKEPLALVMDENQSDWADVVNWVLQTLVEAEKLGITQSNVDQLIATSTDPVIRRFLGVEDNLGGTLGLSKDFAAQIIKAVGNYGEIYNRNFDANVLPRDMNERFENFGLQYALPFGATPESVIAPPSDGDDDPSSPSTPGQIPTSIPGGGFPTPNSPSPNTPSDSETPNPSTPTLDLNILGTDSVMGSTSNEQILGSEQDNLILALDGNDLIQGADGNDTLIANKGNDTLEAGNGNDLLYGGQGDDLLDGQGGEDTLFGDKGNDTLVGGIDDDWVNGNQGNDIVNGNEGDDILYGGQDNDQVFGGVGNDTLFGDKGNDTLTGGEGSDRFFLMVGNGSDLVSDFQDGEDQLLLDEALTFEQLQITAEGNATLIQVDGQILMRLQGVNAALMTQDDFVSLF